MSDTKMSVHDAVEDLQGALRGELIQPGDEGYESARTVFNAMIDKRPAFIARCVDAADVIAAVNFARKNDVLVAIRGGGHNGGGLGICDNGLVIDLSPMKSVHVDPEQRTARVGGGGGNFGVVTSFVFELHPISTIIGGPTLWPLEQAPEVLRWYRDFITEAPEDLNGFFAFLVVPPGPPFPEELHLKNMCGIVWCYTGPEEKADEVFAPVLEVGTPALHGVQAMPYPALQSAFDGLYPPGLQWYWKADFVNEISDEAIEQHMKYAEMPTMHSTMHLYPVNGAAHKVGKNDTAFSYREANWAQVIVGVDPDPANNERTTSWTRSYWEALHPYSGGGAYVNMMMEEGQDRIRASYRDNYERLAAIKHEYDPTNFFRVNQNIKPGG